VKYRTLGRTGLEVSEIGFGSEHMPSSREVMSEVLAVAVDAGLSYVDLLQIDPDPSSDGTGFWSNCGPPIREHRDRLVLAAHWGGGPRYDLPYCQRTFAHVLSQVGNDYVDVAIMTMVDEPDRRGAWLEESLKHLRRHQEQGHLGFIGGSGHDVAVATELVKSGLLDVFMFGVNLTKHGDEQHRALYRACVEQGVGLVAMKPYFGGTLLTVDGRSTSLTPVQCLSYVLSQPVSTTVPGVRSADQMRAALAYCAAGDEERDYAPALANMYHDLEGHCVYCNHCLPCPQGIDVATTIMLADWGTPGVNDELREWYASLKVKPGDCIRCARPWPCSSEPCGASAPQDRT
jgi:predicted aldo/keto reductase-like oxidoreductase